MADDSTFLRLVKEIEFTGSGARYSPDGYASYAESVIALWNLLDPELGDLSIVVEFANTSPDLRRATRALNNVEIWSQNMRLKKADDQLRSQIDTLFDELESASTMVERREFAASLNSLFSSKMLMADIVTRTRVRNLGFTPDGREFFDKQIERLQYAVRLRGQEFPEHAAQFIISLLTSYLIVNGQFPNKMDRAKLVALEKMYRLKRVASGAGPVKEVFTGAERPGEKSKLSTTSRRAVSFADAMPHSLKLPTARVLNFVVRERAEFAETIGGAWESYRKQSR